MSFKIKPPYPIDNTPVYGADMEKDVLGRTNKNGAILVNNNLSGKDIDRVIKHEKVHVEQFKNVFYGYHKFHILRCYSKLTILRDLYKV